MAARPFMSTDWRRIDGESDPGGSDTRGADNGQRDSPASNRIYVGNMPYTAQIKDVEELFADAGIGIANIDISIDPFTSRNPSYCFVDLANTEDVKMVLSTFPGKLFCGRPLKVNSNVNKGPKQRNQYSNRLQMSRWKSLPKKITQDDVASRGEHPAQRLGSFPPPLPTPELLEPIGEKRRLFLGGLPQPKDNYSSDLEIRRIFKGFDVVAVSKVKSPRAELLPGNAWYAFVDLKDADQAETAIKQLNGMPMWGSKITVSLAEGLPAKVLETIAKEEAENERGRRVQGAAL